MNATYVGFFPAKDMSGYGPAGRGAIIHQRIPSERIPTERIPSERIPSERIFVPPIYTLKIDHLSNLLRRMNIMGAMLVKMAVFLR